MDGIFLKLYLSDKTLPKWEGQRTEVFVKSLYSPSLLSHTCPLKVLSLWLISTPKLVSKLSYT